MINRSYPALDGLLKNVRLPLQNNNISLVENQSNGMLVPMLCSILFSLPSILLIFISSSPVESFGLHKNVKIDSKNIQSSGFTKFPFRFRLSKEISTRLYMKFDETEEDEQNRKFLSEIGHLSKEMEEKIELNEAKRIFQDLALRRQQEQEQEQEQKHEQEQENVGETEPPTDSEHFQEEFPSPQQINEECMNEINAFISFLVITDLNDTISKDQLLAIGRKPPRGPSALQTLHPELLSNRSHILCRHNLFEEVMRRRLENVETERVQYPFPVSLELNKNEGEVHKENLLKELNSLKRVDSFLSGYVSSERKTRARLKVNYILAGAEIGQTREAIRLLSDT